MKNITLHIKAGNLGADGHYTNAVVRGISGTMITTRTDVQKGLDSIIAHALSIIRGVAVQQPEQCSTFDYAFPVTFYGDAAPTQSNIFTATMPITLR